MKKVELRWGFVSAVMAMVFFVLVLTGCKGPVSPVDPVVDPPVTEPSVEDLEVLSNLGIDTNLGNRKDAFGQDLPDRHNPLGKEITALSEHMEFYFTGPSYNDTPGDALDYNEVLMEVNSSGSMDFLHHRDGYTGTANEWKERPKKACAADVDGDGIDEIVIGVIFRDTKKIHIRVQKGQTVKTVFVVDIIDDNIWSSAYSDKSISLYSIDITAGDFDGDAKEEIIFSAGSTLYLFDELEKRGRLAGNIDCKIPGIIFENHYVQVEAGDFDVDPCDEEFIVFLGSNSSGYIANYRVYDGFANYSQIHNEKVSTREGTVTHSLIGGQLIVGDFDNDNFDEAAFGGKVQNKGNEQRVIILDFEVSAEGQVNFAFKEVASKPQTISYPFPCIARWDHDGVKGDSIYFANRLLTLEKNGTISEINTSTKISEYEPVAGDLDGDGREELANLTVLDTTKEIFFLTHDTSSNTFQWLHNLPKFSSSLNFDLYRFGTNIDKLTFCMANVDRDSPILKFEDHHLVFTSPKVQTVVASPPYKKGIVQNWENSYTAVGTTHGSGTTHSASAGIIIGRGVGVNIESPFWGSAGEFSTKVTAEFSFTYEGSSECYQTTSYGYECPAGEDMVVYTSIPMDIYNYKIISSPDISDIGKIYTISIPRGVKTVRSTVEFFNENNGNYPDIGKDILKHTIGDPKSYHSYAEMLDLKRLHEKRGYFAIGADERTAGQGAGLTNLEFSKDHTVTNAFSFDLDILWETEGKIAGVTFSATDGIHGGYSYATSYSNGFYIDGAVGNVAESINDFSWGLMYYPVQYGNHIIYVTTYWVD